MDDDGSGDGELRFERTRDGDLHRAIRDDGFSLPAGLGARSPAMIVVSAALPFVYIAGAIALVRAPIPLGLALLLAFPLLLAAQRAFLTLVHDASHKLFSRDRRRNDLVADFLAAGFIGLLLRKYRKIHLAHHSANGSADDPEHFGIVAVTRVGGWTRFIARYALGLEVAYLLGKYHSKQDAYLGERRVRAASVDEARPLEKASIVAAQAALIAAFWASGALPLYLLWLYTAVTWAPLLSRLRFLAEHPGRGELTLSTHGRWWELVFFAPYNFNYHLEHHLWPSLPPYALGEAHAALVAAGFFERHPQFLADSFVGTLAKYEVHG